MSHPLELFRFCPVCGSNKFIENNNQSKRCETCGFIDYINPKAAVVAVITNTKGDILVCRRAKDPAKGTLDMPGGFTDLNETAEEAVIREVKEETGLTVTATRYLFSLPNSYMNSKGKLKLFRSEAVRVGFSRLWKDKNYRAIVNIAERLPEQTIQEDPNLLMYYDISLSRV